MKLNILSTKKPMGVIMLERTCFPPLNRKIMSLVLFIVLSFTFAGRVFAQVGFPNFREGDILYCRVGDCSDWGHVGILLKIDEDHWMVRESCKKFMKVRSISFWNFYGRDAIRGCRIELLKVNCSDSLALWAADTAKSFWGLYSYPAVWPISFSCSFLVWKAYNSATGIDLRLPVDPPTNPSYILPLELSGSPETTNVGQIRIGDLNYNNFVNINDLQACVNHILSIQNWGSGADVNGDGSVNALDIQHIVNIILCINI